LLQSFSLYKSVIKHAGLYIDYERCDNDQTMSLFPGKTIRFKHKNKMKKIKEIEVGRNTFEITADEKDLAIIQRHLNVCTKCDLEIESLPFPKNPKWLHIMVRLIRYYQKKISPKLGNRCVFDPSCSHYSELAFRRKGFLKGIQLTGQRLYRCRPGNGGIDLID